MCIQLPVHREVSSLLGQKARQSSSGTSSPATKNLDHRSLVWCVSDLVSLHLDAREAILHGHTSVHLMDRHPHLSLVQEHASYSPFSLSWPLQLAGKNHPGDLPFSNSHLHDRRRTEDPDLHSTISHVKLHVSHRDLCRCLVRALLPDVVF